MSLCSSGGVYSEGLAVRLVPATGSVTLTNLSECNASWLAEASGAFMSMPRVAQSAVL